MPQTAPDRPRPNLAPAFNTARRFPRKAVNIVNVLLSCDGITTQRVTVRDISPGGLQFHAPVSYRVGTLVSLQLPLGGQNHLVEGMVRYVRPIFTEAGRVYTHGVEFVGRDPLLHRILNHL